MAAEQNQLCNSWRRIENTCEGKKEGRKEEARRKGNQYTAGGGGRIIVDKSKLAFSFARSSFTGFVT